MLPLRDATLRPGFPDFLDLPWEFPLEQWGDRCARLEALPQGVSRHPIAFVNYDGSVFALKGLPLDLAKKEYGVLLRMEDLCLPAVTPVGWLQLETNQEESGVLITRYLDQSLPYRTLFMRPSMEDYRRHLLDAIAGLLVQLHLAEVYWGDSSLSNTLFRRDAGALRAYLVDAETSEVYEDGISPVNRFHDLQIMEENVEGELADLQAENALSPGNPDIPLMHTGSYISLRYQSLWDQITRVDIINPDEQFRIQERIRALNELGFSVGDLELTATNEGDQLRLRVIVTDRNFHRHQLQSLIGLDVEEMQARKMVNEIQEVKARLSRSNNRSTPLSVAAYHWLEYYYDPITSLLGPLVDENTTQAELYCHILEHKWYLSEQAQHDVGHKVAALDFMARFRGDTSGIND